MPTNVSRNADKMASREAVYGEISFKVRDMIAASGLGVTKGAWNAVARRIGVTPARVKALAYQQCARIDAWEADQIRALHKALATKMDMKREVEEALARAMGATDEIRTTGRTADLDPAGDPRLEDWR